MADETERTREQLGRELERALESVLFNLEHGVPRASVQRLERLAEDLVGYFGQDPDLVDEIRQFHTAVARFLREPDATDTLLRHGHRLVALLVPRAQ